MGSNKVIPGKNDLESQNPGLVTEWDYSRNSILPSEIACKSNKLVWWKCSTCTYEWQSTVNNRSRGNGCPCCSNQVVVPGKNDLLTTNKNLAEDWDYESNDGITPDSIVQGSSKRIWWKCHICGHKWNATPASRSRGAGCPSCGKTAQLNAFHTTMIEKRGSLAQANPLLVEEWIFDRNAPLTPEKVLPGSNDKVWWKCSTCGHEWQASIHSRSNGVGCPLCSNRIVIKEKNDLASLRPDLLSEWNYQKNTILPDSVTTGSGVKVWWKCSFCCFEWQASVASRTKGSGCPECASRAQTSFPEQAIFYYVKRAFPDAENRHVVIDGKKEIELDVFIPTKMFAIEYDGSKWHNTEASDRREQKKFAICKDHGIKLLRIKETGAEIKVNDVSDIADFIIYCNPHPSDDELNDIITTILSTLNAAYKVNCGQDAIEIRGQYYRTLSEKSIAHTHPELVLEWSYVKNRELTPMMVTAGSSVPVWWKCNKGHEWKTTTASRIYFNSSCPFCANKKVLRGYNDVATTHPEVLSAWDYENNTIQPDSIIAGNSTIAVSWVCKKGHRFKMSIYSYLKLSDQKCPICSGKQVLEGFNDLLTTDTELCAEWDMTKNDLTPKQVTRHSQKKVWWRCANGHEWEATVSNRANGTGCPFCSNKRVLPGWNDLCTTNPNLLEEWDYEKNTISPKEIVAGSTRKVWWKCSTCGFSWLTAPAYRIKNGRKTNCPACSNNTVNPGRTDFESLYPIEATWWDYDKNGDLKPSMVGPGSDKRVWWR